MNPEAQVLQALDAAQAALKRLQTPPPEGAVGMEEAVASAHRQVLAAPWSMVLRSSEADQHGWLAQLREALQQIEDDPYGEEVDRRVDEGLWAANELERDLRTLVGAR